METALDHNQRLLRQRREWQTLEAARIRQQQHLQRLKNQYIISWVTLFITAAVGVFLGAFLF